MTPELVRELLSDQCPDLADLELQPFAHGWDNEMFRLGDTLLARFPRREATAVLLEHEARWLPTLANHLTTWTPRPIFVGRPTSAFPWTWTIAPFLAARAAAAVPVPERTPAAEDLADFFGSLHLAAPLGAPVNPVRGMALDQPAIHARVLERLAREGGRSGALAERWHAWSRAPEWEGPDVWLHGDAHALNVLLTDTGRLAGVVDWGDITSGDPACDLAAGWLIFDEEGRRRFVARCSLNPAYDEHVWARARAWALQLGLILAQQADDQPLLRATGELALANVLAETPEAR
nr:aminoglycoside phosphotransferase family protein [Propionibacterium sp.]